MIRFIIVVLFLGLYLVLGIPVLGVEWLIGSSIRRPAIIRAFGWYNGLLR